VPRHPLIHAPNALLPWSLTSVAALKLALHVIGQAMPVGLLVTMFRSSRNASVTRLIRRVSPVSRAATARKENPPESA